MILYWTVFTEFNGAVNFRNDTYGWDSDFAASSMLAGSPRNPYR
jgi:murein L,D-transpeptidase YcbB/YkuD